jgi:transcription elongation GreA/GreB family factor
MSRLRALVSLAKTWPICLASATVAYLAITGLLLFLASDIAALIVNNVLTARLVITALTVFLLLNMLLALTYAASLFIIRHEGIAEGLRRNSRKLVKGFILLSISSLTCLAIMLSIGYHALFSASPVQNSLGLIAMGYGTGVIASILFVLPLVWLLTSLAGERFWIGFGRLVSTIALFLLMLAILSAYGLPGLFIDSMLIPTVISIVAKNGEKAKGNAEKNRPSWFKGRSIRKASSGIILAILVLSAEIPFRSISLSFAEEARFSEDRLRSIVSKAIAEGWSSGELANAIKNEPELSMLSTYDLSSITIERDDAGSVIVTIPLNAMGYAIYRRTSNKTTVYDVYSQGGSSEIKVGDKRYVLVGYRSREETYGPFETLEEARAKEDEVKRNANATRIISNTTLKTEAKEVTRTETRYAIVPIVKVAKYEVKAEFENYWDAQNYLYTHPGFFEVAEIKEVEKQVWVYSYELEFVKETTNHYEAVMMSRDGYVTEEVREKIIVYIFEKTSPISRLHILGTVEIKKADFEKMIQTGELVKSIDENGEEYYYYSSQGPYSARLYKTGEKQVDGDVVAWRIYRRIDTSHWETRKAYQVVVQNGYEEKKVSIDDLPNYAKGFQSREDAEGSKGVVEQSLKNWVNSQGMTYKSCEVEPYEETVTRLETVTREVKQYYVIATFLKPVYDVYELRPYYRAWNETYYEEKWGWVFKGYVNKTPETYDMSTWVYAPEVVNWTSKTYLGIVTELEAQILTSMDPRYVAEKYNTTTIIKETSYYDVYNATWKLLYHYYKYVTYPFHEYIANGNVSSSGGWSFESLGDASGEVCSSTYRSSPSSLRIVSHNGRGAWRQTFYFDAGGSSPVLDFWYILRGSGAVAIKKPDGSAHVFALDGSSSWSRFLRNSGDVFSQAGYYTISFVASENSELYVDDVSVHVGGYGEWVYQGDVENKPDNVPPNEKYEAFYRIENKKFIGTFEESVANQYPTPPYIKEFNRKEKVSYVVDLYKLYYLEGGFVRYRVFHWEKYQVPIIVRKEESGERWELAESNVEMDTGGRILIESNVPENIVRAKYNNPTKYYLVPRIVEGGEMLELVCETLDESLAKKYEGEGYVVKRASVSQGNPVRFSMRVLQASIERNELNMLGKQNTMKVAIANPTGDTLTYQVVIEAENTLEVERIAGEAPQAQLLEGAVKRVTSIPVAEPSSWLLPVPPGGTSCSLAFTAWVRRTFEGEYDSFSEDVAYWPSQVRCDFVVKVLRNGRLVAKQRLLETFEGFDVGRTIARHPFETIGGFLMGFASTAAMTAMWLTPGLQPLAGLITAVSLGWSTMNALLVYSQTGNAIEALTVSPFGVAVAPLRALADPTMDDSTRASIIGALIGVPFGAYVGREVALDVAMMRMPSELRNSPEVYGRLYKNEEKWGTPLASSMAESIGKVYPYLNVPNPEELVAMILDDALKSRQDAVYIASMLRWMAEMDKGFLSQHAGNLMEFLASPLLRSELSPLLTLSPEEALQLSQSVGGDFIKMLRLAEFKAALEQLSKLGPDVARILSISNEGIEVGVEKSLAGKLYPSIQKGTIVEFEFARGNVVLKGMLAYAGEKNVGEGSYMVFAFKAEQHTPAIFELLKEDLQSIKVVPGQQVEKTFGFNAFRFSEGKLSMDRGILGMDGSIRFGDGMVLRLEDPSVMLVPNENPLETGELNKMLLGGRIGGTSIVVGEDGVAKAFHGGSYLPAVVSASSLGLQLGLLAKPSGETLMITQADLAQRGIADPGLLNVFYPNGETSTVIFTGKDLQAPLFSYSSGAFVGVQAVETRIVWTSVDKRAFYEQITSVSELLGSILGSDFKEELLKSILLSDLTDSQVLDVVNTLAKNVEWLKTLNRGRRIELVRKITEYVKKGDTAEEAVEKAKRESEEYVKSIENEIAEFCSSISIYDAQLAKEALELINCVKKNLGYDAAKWLLDVSKRVYSKALNESKGNREVANAKLRDVVEKVFRYPESTLEGCALASAIVSEMREKSIEQAWEELNRIANYPDGIRVKGILSKEGGKFRIRLSKTLLASYLGDEACWVRIEVKGRTIYREYKPAYNYFNLPEDIGEDGEEVEITIKKITTYDFIKATIKGAGAPFDIVCELGGYWLTMNEQEVCEVSMEEDLYHDRGDHGPAVIFAIRDYWGGEHLIKLVHKESKEYVCKIRIGSISFREIRNVKYEEKRSRLIIEYSQERAMSEATSKHEIFLENPKSVLVRMAEELREIISAKGLPEVNPEAGILTGEVGWYYVRLYHEDEIKEIVSKMTGIPKEELHVFQGYEREGPDFYVYHKSELIAIVEVKTSVTSMDSLQDRIKKEAIPQVKRYLHGEWKDARFGIIVPIYLKDLDRIIETEFREGVLCLISKDNYENYKIEP